MKRSGSWKRPLLLLVILIFVVGCQTTPEKGLSGRPVQLSAEVADLGPQSTSAKGELRILMLAVRFPDVQPRFPLARIKKRTVTRLNAYVKTQSYDQAWVNPHFMGWVPLPDPLYSYKVSPNNFKVDRRKVRKLIQDSMTAVERRVDFSQYDHMLIIPGAFTLPGKGYGMMCYCANPGMLTGVRGNPRFVTLRSRSGKEFSGGIFVGTENAHLGMFAHDLFHALGGVHKSMRLAP
jgi:hypothetical protein